MRDYFASRPVSNEDRLEELLAVLAKDSANGFRFDTVAIKQLSERTGIWIDTDLRDTLKQRIYRRNDGACFLLDSVAGEGLREGVTDKADEWLDEYGFFEIAELYKLYSDNLNELAIRDLDDFRIFYEHLNKRPIHCITFKGIKIVHTKTTTRDEVFTALSKRIIGATRTEFGGFIDEETLKKRFPSISAELLSNIVRNHSDELVKTETSKSSFYRTLEAPVLSDDFPGLLSETLRLLDDLKIDASEAVIHTALSLKLGVNFKIAYSVPHQATFKRIIADNYKDEPKRKWKSGLFLRVAN
ncbi:MAG: hypothetical protein LBC41_18615 [Clostridiales bacterium]|jgi:hypothetical protein|nr:hypothetical protein [Clostridiales bacterium]MDR2752674.1 hypothetical protein [Clostridiales bacterium]